MYVYVSCVSLSHGGCVCMYANVCMCIAGHDGYVCMCMYIFKPCELCIYLCVCIHVSLGYGGGCVCMHACMCVL